MSSCPFAQQSHKMQGQSRLQRVGGLQGLGSSITLVPVLSPHTTTPCTRLSAGQGKEPPFIKDSRRS